MGPAVSGIRQNIREECRDPPFFLTEEGGECRPVLERSEPVVALHEGLAQRARTRAAAAVDGVHAVPVRGRRLAR